MTTHKIILVGGGGHCKSVIDIAEAAGWEIVGVLDTEENLGKDILGYKVIGTDDCIINYINEALFLVTVGYIKNPDLRIKLHNLIIAANGKLATIIAPDAYVSPYAQIEEGTVIMHKAVVNAGAHVGKGCIINTFANIEHEVTIGDYCHISTGAIINGNCTIGEKTFIGSGTIVSNGITIANRCLVGASSFVRKSLTESGLYSGNPAKKYR